MAKAATEQADKLATQLAARRRADKPAPEQVAGLTAVQAARPQAAKLALQPVVLQQAAKPAPEQVA